MTGSGAGRVLAPCPDGWHGACGLQKKCHPERTAKPMPATRRRPAPAPRRAVCPRKRGRPTPDCRDSDLDVAVDVFSPLEHSTAASDAIWPRSRRCFPSRLDARSRPLATRSHGRMTTTLRPPRSGPPPAALRCAGCAPSAAPARCGGPATAPLRASACCAALRRLRALRCARTLWPRPLGAPPARLGRAGSQARRSPAAVRGCRWGEQGDTAFCAPLPHR